MDEVEIVARAMARRAYELLGEPELYTDADAAIGFQLAGVDLKELARAGLDALGRERAGNGRVGTQRGTT